MQIINSIVRFCQVGYLYAFVLIQKLILILGRILSRRPSAFDFTCSATILWQGPISNQLRRLHRRSGNHCSYRWVCRDVR